MPTFPVETHGRASEHKTGENQAKTEPKTGEIVWASFMVARTRNGCKQRNDEGQNMPNTPDGSTYHVWRTAGTPNANEAPNIPFKTM